MDAAPLTSDDVRRVRFERSFWGYSQREVDRFLKRATLALETSEAGGDPDLTASDVTRITFGGALIGYAEGQVDVFLDELAEALHHGADSSSA